MTIHIRKLYRALGPANASGDTWNLVFDDQVKTLRVEHESAHGVVGLRSKIRNGTRNYDLDARVAKVRLITTLKELFESEGGVA